MWKIILAVLEWFIGWRKRAAAKKAEEERRAIADAENVSDNIRKEVDDIEKDELDSSSDADDPGGFGSWNCKR